MSTRPNVYLTRRENGPCSRSPRRSNHAQIAPRSAYIRPGSSRAISNIEPELHYIVSKHRDFVIFTFDHISPGLNLMSERTIFFFCIILLYRRTACGFRRARKFEYVPHRRRPDSRGKATATAVSWAQTRDAPINRSMKTTGSDINLVIKSVRIMTATRGKGCRGYNSGE